MGKNTHNNKSNSTIRTTSDKKKKFIEALKLNLGNITEACKASNVGRQTYYDWIDKDEDFKQQCEDVGESLLDLAENKLLEKINKYDTTSIIFFLKTKGKKRGYIEKQEFEVHKPIEDITFDEI